MELAQPISRQLSIWSRNKLMCSQPRLHAPCEVRDRQTGPYPEIMKNHMGVSALIKIRAEKDFWAGLLYVLLAAAFLWFGRDYKMGAAARMGPGYFPLTLGWILGAFGAVSMVRSFFSNGAPVGNIAWKKL